MGFPDELLVTSNTFEFVCAICHEIMQHPTKLDCCTHAFCQTCITKWTECSRACPLCKAHISSLHNNDALGQQIESLKVRCPHHRLRKYSFKNPEHIPLEMRTLNKNEFSIADFGLSFSTMEAIRTVINDSSLFTDHNSLSFATCCPWQGNFRDVKQHLENECQYHMLICKKCKSIMHASVSCACSTCVF